MCKDKKSTTSVIFKKYFREGSQDIWLRREVYVESGILPDATKKVYFHAVAKGQV